MKIALIGRGNMGSLLKSLAKNRKHDVIIQERIATDSMRGADVCIDFSHPSAVVDNVKLLAQMGVNVIMGTTGWLEQLDNVKTIVQKSNIGFLYSPNFSIGVNVFLKIVAEAASLIDGLDYDVGMMELHHNKKADSPSGTAKAISDQLLANIKKKQSTESNAIQGQISEQALHVASLRCGSIPGTHTVIFDSAVDTISLTHQARNREGFAHGALVAAEWIHGKKGFFTMEEMLNDK